MTIPNAQNNCADCGRELPASGDPCPGCGSTRVNVTLVVPGAHGVSVAGSLGLVADSPATPERPHSITVQTPLGARSEAHFASDGTVTLRATGCPDVGTRGEPQVRDILRERLATEGFSVEFVPGAINERGEDGVLILDGSRLVLQVTSVPGTDEYWRQAVQSSAVAIVDPERAIAWLRSAVESKRNLDGRRSTLLAIDARHAGVLSDHGLADQYRQRYSSPATEFGFAQAWVVGPTASHCTRL
jgi:hypothetical protein